LCGETAEESKTRRCEVAEVFTESPPSRSIRPYAGAEDENIDLLRQYYFKNTIYEKVVADLPLRILVGHKGIGKSALFQGAMQDDIDHNRLPIFVRPDDIEGIGDGSPGFNPSIREWKRGLRISNGNSTGGWSQGRDLRRIDQVVRPEYSHRYGKEQTDEWHDLVEPVFCGRSSLIIFVSPITKRMAPLKYGQNTSAWIGKTASAKARRGWWNNWKLQFSIFIIGSPLPDSESQSP
jgi:hypothetical protein